MNKQLEIKTLTCKASFTSVYPQLDYVRVEGWISAPSKDRGFEFSHQVGEAIGREYLGGFCIEDNGPVNFPFSFDVTKEYLSKFYRLETTEEIINRVFKSLRKAKRTVK